MRYQMSSLFCIFLGACPILGGNGYPGKGSGGLAAPDPLDVENLYGDVHGSV